MERPHLDFDLIEEVTPDSITKALESWSQTNGVDSNYLLDKIASLVYETTIILGSNLKTDQQVTWPPMADNPRHFIQKIHGRLYFCAMTGNSYAAWQDYLKSPD